MANTLGRRAFLGATMASGAALLADRLSTPADAAVPESAWLDAPITQLQSLMATRRLSSVELTQAYLTRIAAKNPVLHAVIETNPDALAIARRRDKERRDGNVRGPLHGIPILLKDNIATADRMQSTAGSLALVGSVVPADAVVATRLRAAGAVILGKTNLSEWANMRGNGAINGWSARGGITMNPYDLSLDPCGSSSGSGVAPAANLSAGAVGTETDGSVLCPSSENHIVGLKPTLGLISQKGIIPIAHSQDTAGPMARSVMDVAIMLNAMRSPFGAVAGESSGEESGDHGDLPADYTAFVRPGALHGARIGVDKWFLDGGGFGPDDAGRMAVFNRARDAMAHAGATIIDVDGGDPGLYVFDDEFTVLLCEFKDDIAAYLAPLRNSTMRTLADLIAFNTAHCSEELKYFGQEVFELAESTGGMRDPAYAPARANCIRRTRAEGIDRVIREHRLDALVAPTFSWATSPAAVAGYPSMSVPFALTTDGRPAGLWMYSGFLREPKLLALAYAIEQIRPAPRATPGFVGTPRSFPDAGLCGGTAAATARRAVTTDHHPRHF